MLDNLSSCAECTYILQAISYIKNSHGKGIKSNQNDETSQYENRILGKQIKRESIKA